MKLINITAFIMLTLNYSCKEEHKMNPSQLISIDKEFYKYSIRHGHQEAFLKYCSEDIVILENNRMPIKGIEELKCTYLRVR